MNSKIKNIFKISTVAMTIMSIVGCSITKPQPEIYGYRLQDKLEKNEKIVITNGQVKDVTVDEKHRIKTIKLISQLMNKTDCTNMEWKTVTETKIIIQETSEPLISLKTSESLTTYSNKILNMKVNSCKKADDSNENSYWFEINVDSLGDNVEVNQTMKSIKKSFAKLAMGAIVVVGVVLIIPVLILGFIFISIPAMIVGLFTGGK